MAEISIANRYRTEDGCEVTILKTGLAGKYSVLGLVHCKDGCFPCSWTKEGKPGCEIPGWGLVPLTYPEVNLNLKYQTLDGSRVTLVSNKGSQPDCILGIVHRDTWDFPWRWDKYGKSDTMFKYNLEEIPEEKEEKVDFGSW